MDQLEEKERHDLSILACSADPLIAHLLTVAADGQEWLDPEKVMSMSKEDRLETSFYRHHCLIKDGTIYVHDGQYIPLVTYLRKAYVGRDYTDNGSIESLQMQGYPGYD